MRIEGPERTAEKREESNTTVRVSSMDEISFSSRIRGAMEERWAAFVFLFRHDEALFVRHTESSNNPSGTYSLPGGRVEPGEDPRNAVVREVFEETGLAIRSSDLVELGTRSENIETKRGMETWNGKLYSCETFQGEIRKMEEAEEPSWLKIDDVLEGKYRMPKMSPEYSSFIMETLRNQKKE